MSTSPQLVCWKCGASLAALSLPLQRLDECKACSAELHVCKLCVWYDVRVAKHCRETIAEEVKDKERANFCDYFRPRENAYSGKSQTEATQAKAALDALFGNRGSETAAATPADANERARAELESLFGKRK